MLLLGASTAFYRPCVSTIALVMSSATDPTTLTLPRDQVDKIVGMGQTLLRESPEFQKLLKDLQTGS